MGKLKLPVIIGVFIVTLALLLAGQHFIVRQRSINGLEAQFAALPGVRAAAILSLPEGLSLTVHLGPQVGLKSTYDQILIIAKRAGIPPHRIALADQRDSRLNQALHDIHATIAWGIATGEFPTMLTAVESVLAARGIEAQEVWVEKEYVYLEMHAGREHLYQVFSRDSAITQWPELSRGAIWGEG